MKTNDYFKVCMQLVLDKEVGAEVTLDEDFADNQLLTASKCAMALKLHKARGLGRHGWWNENVCDIEYLYSLRQKALSDNDHVSVLNFTAMIAMRESVQS